MNFFRFPGILEYTFLALFGFLYFLYVGKTIYVAYVLKSNSHKVIFKIILRSIYLLLILVSLLGPSFGEIKKEIKSVGKDIYIAVDLSQSMNCRDIQPSRLEKLKFNLKEVTNSFSSDRIGLIVFSSEAFVQCPLTFDMAAINLFIDILNTNLVPSGGTDFESALDMIDKRFEADVTNKSNTKSKIAILISDGEDFGNNSEDIAENLKDKGVKLFCLGIGTERGAKIPDGNSYKLDTDGQPAISKLNANDLKNLSSITKGLYYEISDNRNDLKKMIEDISSIEGQVREVKSIDTTANKYFYFLLAALVLACLDILITVKAIKI